jgi:hypothetical protein
VRTLPCRNPKKCSRIIAAGRVLRRQTWEGLPQFGMGNSEGDEKPGVAQGSELDRCRSRFRALSHFVKFTVDVSILQPSIYF